MEFFAKNAGIRRATGDWILTTNSDVFLGREIVARLAEGRLVPGTLYRASRLDLDRAMPRDGVTWERLEDPRHLLRRFDPEPPYLNEAAGDFLLLDRESYHRVGGFNERVRFTKIHKDGQFCVQAHHHGLAIESIGPVYHIDHDGSFINTRHTYQPGYADAPFGPDWDVLGAVLEPRGLGRAAAPSRNRTARPPGCGRRKKRGPALSLVLHGAGTRRARLAPSTRCSRLRRRIELLVVDPEPHRWRSARGASRRPAPAPARRARRRARHADGQCAARRARLRARPPSGLPARSGRDRRPATCCGAARALARRRRSARPCRRRGGRARRRRSPLTIVSRRALDRLDGVDALAADLVGEFADRARRTFGATVDRRRRRVRAAAIPRRRGHDTAVDAAWSALGDGGIVPAIVAADLTRRGELLTAHIRERLARELPDDARDVAVFGLGPMTPFAMAARPVAGAAPRRRVRAGRRRQPRRAQGMPVRPPVRARRRRPSLWVVAACTSPADVAALLAQVPIERTVHLVEPPSLRPDAPAFLTATSFEGLLHARGLRTAGALREAEAAYRARCCAIRVPSTRRRRATNWRWCRNSSAGRATPKRGCAGRSGIGRTSAR